MKKVGIFGQSYKKIDRPYFETLIQTEDIGDRIAKSVMDWFLLAANQELIQELKAQGLQLENAVQAEATVPHAQVSAFPCKTIRRSPSRRLSFHPGQRGGSNATH